MSKDNGETTLVDYFVVAGYDPDVGLVVRIAKNLRISSGIMILDRSKCSRIESGLDEFSQLCGLIVIRLTRNPPNSASKSLCRQDKLSISTKTTEFAV